MKLTVITNHMGELVAVVRAHISEHDRNKNYKNGPHATLRPGPGQTFHEIELAPEYEKKSSTEIRRKAMEHVRMK